VLAAANPDLVLLQVAVLVGLAAALSMAEREVLVIRLQLLQRKEQVAVMVAPELILVVVVVELLWLVLLVEVLPQQALAEMAWLQHLAVLVHTIQAAVVAVVAPALE
jgi:hypothetical protein